jgi:hypothetical protein
VALTALRSLRNRRTTRSRGTTQLESLLLLGAAAAGVAAFAGLGNSFDSAIAGALQGAPSAAASPSAPPAAAPSAQAGVAHVVAEAAELLGKGAGHAADYEQAARVRQWLAEGKQITHDTDATIQRLGRADLAEDWRALRQQYPELRGHGTTTATDAADSVLARMDEGILKVHGFRRRLLADAVNAGLFRGQNNTAKYVLHQLGRLDDSDPDLARHVDRALAPLSMEKGFSGLGPIDGAIGHTLRNLRTEGAPAAEELSARARDLFVGRENAKTLLRVTRPGVPEDKLDALIEALVSQDRRSRSGDYDEFGAVLGTANTRGWGRAMGGGFEYPGTARAAHSLDEWPGVLREAGELFREAERASPDAPRELRTPGLRQLAQKTLDVMGERIDARLAQIDSTEAAHVIEGEAAEAYRAVARQAQEQLRAAADSDALSFDELHSLANRLMGITQNELAANRQVILGGLPSDTAALSYVGGRWFPFLSDAKFWTYDRVMDWRHSFGEVFPVEIPVGAKGQYENPERFFIHDSGHVGFAGATVLEPENAERWRALVRAYDAAEASGGVPPEVKLALGNYLWETGIDSVVEDLLRNEDLAGTRAIRARGELRDTLPDELIHFSDRSVEVLEQLRETLAD